MSENISGDSNSKKASIWIDPGKFTGHYYFHDGVNWASLQNWGVPTNLVELKVVPGIVSLTIYGIADIKNVITFKVDADGIIDSKSISPKEAASAADSTLSFKTREVTVQVGDFKGGYQVSGFRRANHQQIGYVTRTYHLLRGLGCFLEFYQLGYISPGEKTPDILVPIFVPDIGQVTPFSLPGAPYYSGAVTGKDNSDSLPTELFINTRKFRVKSTVFRASGRVRVGGNSPACSVEIGGEISLVVDYPVWIYDESLVTKYSKLLCIGPGNETVPQPKMIILEPV